MENDQTLDYGDSARSDLHISFQGHQNLAETAKWAFFLSIIGFIMIGFIVLAALIGGVVSMASVGGYGVLIIILYLAFAAMYFFPVLYLYRFSSGIKQALAVNNQAALDLSLSNLKSHYKFLGIFTIVMLSLYAVLLLIMLVGGASVLGGLGGGF